MVGKLTSVDISAAVSLHSVVNVYKNKQNLWSYLINGTFNITSALVLFFSSPHSVSFFFHSSLLASFSFLYSLLIVSIFSLISCHCFSLFFTVLLFYLSSPLCSFGFCPKTSTNLDTVLTVLHQYWVKNNRAILVLPCYDNVTLQCLGVDIEPGHLLHIFLSVTPLMSCLCERFITAYFVSPLIFFPLPLSPPVPSISLSISSLPFPPDSILLYFLPHYPSFPSAALSHPPFVWSPSSSTTLTLRLIPGTETITDN